MRQIRKSSIVAKMLSNCAKSERFRNWDDFPSEPKKRLREFMLKYEQAGLSAYTEQPLDERMNLHIDHFRRKGIPGYEHLTFCHNNLFTELYTDEYGACHKDKKSHIDCEGYEGEERIFDPGIEDMSQYLTFDLEGRMYPRKEINSLIKKRVDNTIKVFNLNHPVLAKNRKDIFDYIEDYRQGGLADEDIRACLNYLGFPSAREWAIDSFSN